MCISLCTTVIHNTAQNNFDNLPSHPPGNHHCSDVVYWRTEGVPNLNLLSLPSKSFTGWMPFLLPNQRCESVKGNCIQEQIEINNGHALWTEATMSASSSSSHFSTCPRALTVEMTLHSCTISPSLLFM